MTGETNGAQQTTAIPEWIESKLFENLLKKNVENFKSIKEFVVKPGTTAGENYATVMLKVETVVELKDSSTKVLTFMLKINSEGETVREMAKYYDSFEMEKSMYDNIVPELEKLYADIGVEVKFGAKSYDLPVEEQYILLENLCQRGFKNANRLDGLDMDHTKNVLKKIAQWHAASAHLVSVKGPYEEKYVKGLFKKDCHEIIKAIFESLGKVFVACAEEYSNFNVYGKDLKSTYSIIMDEVFKNTTPNPNEFNVLNHGDCWCNNIMFQYDAFGKIKETYFVDYQIPKYGSPAQDLYYFILSSTKLEIKIKEFDYFIKFYHDNLVENLKLLKYSKKIPSLSEIHAMMYKYSIWAYSSVSSIMGAVLLDPTDSANFENFLGDSDAGLSFKKYMFSHDRYRRHAEALLPWLHNRGAFSN